MDPTELKASGRNARRHDARQIEAVKESIARFGFVNPVLADEHMEIVAGHGRVAAAVSSGLSAVPVIIIRGLTDAQKRGLMLADNRIAELSGWDAEILAQTLAELRDDDIPLSALGFSELPDEVLAASSAPAEKPQSAPRKEDTTPRLRVNDDLDLHFGLRTKDVGGAFADAGRLCGAGAPAAAWLLSAGSIAFDADGLLHAYSSGDDATRDFMDWTGLSAIAFGGLK